MVTTELGKSGLPGYLNRFDDLAERQSTENFVKTSARKKYVLRDGFVRETVREGLDARPRALEMVHAMGRVFAEPEDRLKQSFLVFLGRVRGFSPRFGS